MPNKYTIEIKPTQLALCCNGEPVPDMRSAELTQEPNMPGMFTAVFYVGGAIQLGPDVNTPDKEG